MNKKYLFLVVFLVFMMGAACQKESVPATNVPGENVHGASDEKLSECQGTPAECFEFCAKIAVALDKENCYLNILNEQVKEFCGQVSEVALCNDYFVWQSSMNANDCTQISTELWKNRCLESFIDTQAIFNEADFDKDGLSNAKEEELGTDFRKADTDGDGYSDYDEVQAGYNPLTAIKK